MTHYVNVYAVGRSWGGPEEGGWWYDTGEPVASIPFETREEAEAERERLRERYPQTGKRGSVLGGDDYEIGIEDEFARAYPESRPRYE